MLVRLHGDAWSKGVDHEWQQTFVMPMSLSRVDAEKYVCCCYQLALPRLRALSPAQPYAVQCCPV